MKQKIVPALLIAILLIGTACQEDEPLAELPASVPPLSELFSGNFWETEQQSLLFSDGQTDDVALDYCDIDTWEFFEQENLFIIYVHYRGVYHQGEWCDEESYRIVQSYRREGNKLTLDGPHQGFAEDWMQDDFTVSDMQIVPVDSEKIAITYQIRKTGSEASERENAGIMVKQTFFLSGSTVSSEPE